MSVRAVGVDDPDVAVGVAAADFKDHSPAIGYPSTSEGLRSFVLDFRSAVPDLKYTVNREVSEGDVVVQHVTGTGTLKSDFMGMPATGKSATWEEIHIVRVVGGKAAEHWGIVDMLGMLQRLGLAPAPP